MRSYCHKGFVYVDYLFNQNRIHYELREAVDWLRDPDHEVTEAGQYYRRGDDVPRDEGDDDDD